MKTKSGLMLLSLPVLAGLGLLLAAATMRRPVEPAPVRPRAAATTILPPMPSASAMPRLTPETAPKPAPADVATKSADEARIRGTYQNYRTAMATGNVALQGSLEKVLRRDQEVAVKFAQEDLAKARTERDRDIAVRTLEGLRR